MESGPLSNMSSLRKLCSPFSFWRSCCNGTPQDPGGSSRSYEKWKNEMMNKPQIRCIFYIMELIMLILNFVGKLKTESTQNQLKQQVELIEMNIKLLIHEPDLLHSISKLNLKEFDDLLAALHTIDQASTQHDDLVKKIKEILENTKANAGQFDEFHQNLIEDIRKFIQKYHKDQFQAEHQLAPSGSSRDPNRLNNDVAEHIVNLPLVESKPASAEPDSNQIELKSNARIIQLIEHYMVKMDSFKDICTQIAAMYKHSHQNNIEKSESGYTWCGSFLKDIFNGNCKGVEKFLKEHPLALTAKITVDGNTALHIAVKARKLKIVKMLLEKLEKENKQRETLEKQNKERKTALYIAASGGFPIIANELVKANEDTLFIKCENETVPLLPLFVAAKYDKKQVVKYLYEEMKNKTEKDTSVVCFPKKWATFLATLIQNDDYDMALCVNDDHPSLALLKYTNVETPLLALAQRPSLGANKTVGDKASKFRLIPFTGGNKVDHNSTSKASKLLKKIISEIDLQSQESILRDALFKAAEVGSVEFVATIINYLPPVVSWLNDKYRNIFHVAIEHRQVEVFNLIYGLGPVMNDLAGSADRSNNWMLHLTGTLAAPLRLNQVPSAALQLQRELKWFEEVKAIVPNISTNVENLDKKTPYELFVSQHGKLMEAGEKWIKDTASSCSIVAALITTVVFAAAFTIPGGNNQNSGNPIFLTDTWFLIFVISDAVALFSSCTSVLIFMAILTSRFALEDFLVSLPNRLITGIVFLFISMVTMMSAFGVTIYIIIRDRYGWCYIPIIVAGFVPVFTLFRMISTLLIDLWQATWNSIFKKPDRHLYY